MQMLLFQEFFNRIQRILKGLIQNKPWVDIFWDAGPQMVDESCFLLYVLSFLKLCHPLSLQPLSYRLSDAIAHYLPNAGCMLSQGLRVKHLVWNHLPGSLLHNNFKSRRSHHSFYCSESHITPAVTAKESIATCSWLWCCLI